MIDTHCHILPGLDDGAADDTAALEMARSAVEGGVRTIVATPHMREGDYLNEREGILAALESFRGLLAEESIDLSVMPGSEVHLGPRLVERIAEGRLLTYGDAGRYLLLECPYRTRPVRLGETIFELQVAGIVPVIAHPERIRYFQEDPSRYEEVVRLGALGQMTTSSLLGVFGRSVQALSEKMVLRGLVHVLGSDAHDTKYRPPRLRSARSRWAELAGEESAELATEGYPRALIEGTPIDAGPPREEAKRPGWITRLLGR